MTTTVRTFWAPKSGHDVGDYEDAFAVSADGAAPRAAVADGATESAFARPWAETLVRGFAAGDADDADALARALPAWRRAWADAVRPRLDGLPWYAAAKADEGAFAALLGLTLAPGGTWRALAVGDACLFHLAPGAPPVPWPFTSAEAFTNRPALLATRPDAPPPPAETTAGTWAEGDVFLLATDALAAWLLRTGPAEGADLDEADFAGRVEAARTDGTLRNDDVTLVVVRIGA